MKVGDMLGARAAFKVMASDSDERPDRCAVDDCQRTPVYCLDQDNKIFIWVCPVHLRTHFMKPEVV